MRAAQLGAGSTREVAIIEESLVQTDKAHLAHGTPANKAALDQARVGWKLAQIQLIIQISPYLKTEYSAVSQD